MQFHNLSSQWIIIPPLLLLNLSSTQPSYLLPHIYWIICHDQSTIFIFFKQIMSTFHLPIKDFTELLLATSFSPCTFWLILLLFRKSFVKPDPILLCHSNIIQTTLQLSSSSSPFSMTFLLNLFQIFVCLIIATSYVPCTR